MKQLFQYINFSGIGIIPSQTSIQFAMLQDCISNFLKVAPFQIHGRIRIHIRQFKRVLIFLITSKRNIKSKNGVAFF